MTEQEMRVLPVDIDAEQAVCGALLCAPNRFDAAGGLKPSDFYDKRNRLFFELMPEFVTCKTPDYIAMKRLAEKRGVKDIQGFGAYLFELINMVPSTDENSVRHYANIVKEKSLRRTRISQLEGALSSIYDLSVSVDKTDDKICNMILSVESDESGSLVPFGAAFDSFFDDIEARRKSGNKLAGISSGFSVFDTLTGGFEPGRLYVIGGRPAMGKTAFMLNIITNMVLSGKTAALFSLEMGQKEIAKRVVSSISGIKAHKLKTAAVTNDELPPLGEAADRIADRLLISDKPAQTAEEILSQCIRYNTRGRNSGRKIDIVAIDYLQLMGNANKRLDRRLAIGESSRMCKLMAKELNCPVILLSQLSRANEARQEKIPMLSDLRESGDIEQDADVVAFVHRPEYYNATVDNRGIAQIKLDKNRDGEIGTFELKWDKTTTTFSGITIEE